ncbi:MAG: DUF1822 family protein [Cyanobacteria bacterium P01_A01_bin.83]
MSLYEAFISIINEQPELFSPEDKKDLLGKSSTWSKDLDKLGNKIYEWVSVRENIYDAMLDFLVSSEDARERYHLPGNKQTSKIKSENYKQELLDAIHKNFQSPSTSLVKVRSSSTDNTLDDLLESEKVVESPEASLKTPKLTAEQIETDQDKQISSPMSVEVHLPPEVSQQALHFASEQTSVEKAKQVFANTIAVYAVHLYLEAIQIESELEKGNSWQAVQQTVFDLSDLVVPHYGRLECRPVEPNASAITLPSFTEPNCRGYIAVRLPVAVKDSANITKIETVELLGYVKSSEIPEMSGSVSLSSLQSLENMLDDICLIESWTELSQQDDPVVKALQQVLGTREEEFVNRLEQFSKAEDKYDRCDRALEFLVASNVSSGFKNSSEIESSSSEPSMTTAELLDLVEQLWDRLGI